MLDARDRPLTRLQLPGTWLAPGEPYVVLAHHPAEVAEWECVTSHGTTTIASNAITFPDGAPAGPLIVKVRARFADGSEPGLWSRPLRLTVSDDLERVELERERAHRMELMADTDAGGVTLILDPTARPPACPAHDAVWFRTHPLEGGSLLLNEEEAYFRDPFAYYLSCIDLLYRH